jgi:DNA-directed RNA polymerase specialized sigma24 family protein
MTRLLPPASRHAPPVYHDRLHGLIARIAAGDRAAFRTLYAFLAMRVWRDAIRLLPPIDARAVTRSTFVEIWHLAGHHIDHDAHEAGAWIVAISARHTVDRIRTADRQSLLCDSYDQHTHHELVALLGNGEATIRTGPSTFRRVVALAA